jgi:hypothetical protein
MTDLIGLSDAQMEQIKLEQPSQSVPLSQYRSPLDSGKKASGSRPARRRPPQNHAPQNHALKAPTKTISQGDAEP